MGLLFSANNKICLKSRSNYFVGKKTIVNKKIWSQSKKVSDDFNLHQIRFKVISENLDAFCRNHNNSKMSISLFLNGGYCTKNYFLFYRSNIQILSESTKFFIFQIRVSLCESKETGSVTNADNTRLHLDLDQCYYSECKHFPNRLDKVNK